MMNDSVRITLLEPWAMERDGSERPVVIRHGTGAARKISENGGIGGEDVSRFVDAGSFQDVTPRAIRRFIPGEPITYTWKHGDEEQNGLIVPVETAMLYFGDWRRPKTAPPGTPAEDTYVFERKRVAARWGGWQMPSRVDGFSHLQRGRANPDVTCIGVPTMPKVKIESVDNRGRTTGEFEYLPHDHFDFSADVVSELTLPVAVAAPPILTGAGVATLTVDEARRLLAFAEAAEAMASQKPEVAVSGKSGKS